MVSIYKTQQTISNKGAEQEIQRIKDIQERNTTFSRLGGFMLSIRVVLYILIAWSVFTESGFLYPQLFYFTGSKIAAIVVLIMVIAIIEGIKLGGGRLFVRMCVQNWFKDGWHYWGFGALIFLLVGTAFVGSFHFSTRGARHIPKGMDRISSNIDLIDIDAIHSQYDTRINQERQTLSTASTMTWRGNIVSDGREIIAATQATIDQIEEQRQNELNAAIMENQRRQADHDTSLSSIGTWLGAFGGIGEALTLICLLLGGVYERAVYQELPDAPEVAVQKSRAKASQKPLSDESGGQGVPPHRPTVPVDGPVNTVRTVPKVPVPKPASPVLNGRSHLSEQGGTVFASSQGDTAGNSVDTVFLEDTHTILHMGENEEEKRYTRRDVKGMVRKYNNRIKNYQKKIDTGNATDKTEEALANCQAKVRYWQSRLTEFMVPA